MTTEEILASWGVTKYRIQQDGTVDIQQDLDLQDKIDGLAELPVKIRSVTGGLAIFRCGSITSLGALECVTGDLLLYACTSLTSLGSLKRVERGYLVLHGCTALASLGALEEVGGYLDLNECTSLTDLGTLKYVEDVVFLGNSTSKKLEEFQEERAIFKRNLAERPEQAPLLLASSPFAWQRALAKESLNKEGK